MGTANFVFPYPPGFPIMVPGQGIVSSAITFMGKLDAKEIHGYHAAQGLKLLKPDARDAEVEWRTAMSAVVLQQS